MRKLSSWERAALVALLLLTWGLRWVALMDVPPGWRDDDLIELITFSARILTEGPKLYFLGASGHEPLYHTIRAPLLAVAGTNQASARWLAATGGTLAVLLTWAMGRRLSGAAAGLLAGTLAAVSFWSLMYSRVAIRHIGALPWMLLALYWGWRMLRSPTLDVRTRRRAVVGIALGTGGSLLTYYAGRVMPFLLVAAFPFLSPGLRRGRRGRWRPYFTGIGLGVLIALPMFWAAVYLPGADARVGELAVPIHALRSGDPGPLLRTAWTTLGMFHARGDPEWLYNISERPVFGPAGATLFYLAVLANLLRWRRPAARFLLLWLAAGISPALISTPPSSLGHTILALPATYLTLASLVPIVAQGPVGGRYRRYAGAGLGLVILLVVAARDLPDYFVRWPAHSMVQFLYRSDYRALTRYLAEREALGDVGAGSMLFGPWDKVAVRLDDSATETRVRWFSPERALVSAGEATTPLYLQDEGTRSVPIQALLDEAASIEAPAGMQGYAMPPLVPPGDAVTHTVEGIAATTAPFAEALALEAVKWVSPASEDAPGWVLTWWSVQSALPLPPERLIPHPPPPDVYSGPRLKAFAHLRQGDDVVGIDDGLWVDPYSLQPGDHFVQVHRFDAPDDTAQPLTLLIGLYDPLSGERWSTPGGGDHLAFRLTP